MYLNRTRKLGIALANGDRKRHCIIIFEGAWEKGPIGSHNQIWDFSRSWYFEVWWVLDNLFSHSYYYYWVWIFAMYLTHYFPMPPKYLNVFFWNQYLDAIGPFSYAWAHSLYTLLHWIAWIITTWGVAIFHEARHSGLLIIIMMIVSIQIIEAMVTPIRA